MPNLRIFHDRYMVDRDSASRLSPQVQDLLFAMAVSNSCMNPLVYGSYALRLSGMIQRIFKSSCCWSAAASDSAGKIFFFVPTLTSLFFFRYFKKSHANVFLFRL